MARPHLLLPLMIAALSPTPAAAAPTPRGVPIAVSCTGPTVVEGRKIATANGLALGKQAGACFGKMQIYDGNSRQFVVTAASAKCPGGRALDVYERSNAGLWHSFFPKPLCASKVSIGPKNPWGDWMLTIDGKRYDSKGEYYVPVAY